MTLAVLEVNASFVDMAHEYNEDDLSFYHSLPDVRIKTYDLETGRQAVAAPGIGNNVRAVLVALLSSTVLATAIEAHLKKQPTTITISVQHGTEKKSVTFEGPNIKESRPEIEAMLNAMTKDNGKQQVHIVAKRKHHKHPKHDGACE
jgi:hypothetical protein